MFDVSCFRLHERTLSENFGAYDDWRSQMIISFRGEAYITGGELDRTRCIKIANFMGSADSSAANLEMQKVRLRPMLEGHVSHSVCKFRNRYMVVSGSRGSMPYTELYDTQTDMPWMSMGNLN